jgi:hypothetical protein
VPVFKWLETATSIKGAARTLTFPNDSPCVGLQKMMRNKAGSGSLRSGIYTAAPDEERYFVVRRRNLETGNHSSRACLDKTLKAGSWIGLRYLQRNLKPGAEQFRASIGAGGSVIRFRQKSFSTRDFCLLTLIHLSSDTGFGKVGFEKLDLQRNSEAVPKGHDLHPLELVGMVLRTPSASSGSFRSFDCKGNFSTCVPNG